MLPVGASQVLDCVGVRMGERFPMQLRVLRKGTSQWSIAGDSERFNVAQEVQGTGQITKLLATPRAYWRHLPVAVTLDSPIDLAEMASDAPKPIVIDTSVGLPRFVLARIGQEFPTNLEVTIDELGFCSIKGENVFFSVDYKFKLNKGEQREFTSLTVARKWGLPELAKVEAHLPVPLRIIF